MGAGLAVITAWLDGELVDRLGVGGLMARTRTRRARYRVEQSVNRYTRWSEKQWLKRCSCSSACRADSVVHRVTFHLTGEKDTDQNYLDS